ncbi:MAG TPA: FAD-dependent oxidoreductase [Gemmatimonadaceae bacterium]
MPEFDVLIVGAGPTGLVLALWLARAGVRVRLIDKTETAGTTSRALVIHARTLEFYRQLGIVDTIVAASVEFTAVNMWVAGKHAARVPFGDIGHGLTAFPSMLILPQDEHEKLLVQEVIRAGVRVERSTELVSLRETSNGVDAVIRGPDGREATQSFRYLAGADGAHSTVRTSLGVGFPGGTYERVFYVADVQAKGDVMNGELHVALDEADIIAVFPMAGKNRARLLGSIRPEALAAKKALAWNDVSQHAISGMHIDVWAVNWFSTYHVHHRVAQRFRQGRVFLLGDAAHIHSPVGGQGMNTGIGDAVNLAWKLAEVIRAAAPDSLLASYEPERIAFARRLVATTDRAFTFVTQDGVIARAVRLDLVPRLIPAAVKLEPVRRLMFKTISQTAIEYRHSALSVGGAGSVRAGDRLPWIAHALPDGSDNYGPLGARTWQVHVYGVPPEPVVQLCAQRGIPIAQFPWRAEMARAGLRQDAIYLLRPDGHIGYAEREPRLEGLAAYLEGPMRALRATRG